MYAIGFIELNSIAQGIRVADTMLKAAAIELIFTKESCPGKYYILFKGETAAVKESMKAGIAAAEHYCIDHIVIPSVHPDVLYAINQVPEMIQGEALGIVEFFSVASAVLAADLAVKTSNVSILNLRLGTGIGGKSFVMLSGDIGAVEESVKVVTDNQEILGNLLNSTVIAGPTDALLEMLY